MFNSSLLNLATVGIFEPKISTDYPRILHFGPKFFQSYHTWPDVKFTHGFNLAKNSTHARKVLIESVSYACKALEGGKLLHWELGNEPDLYSTSAQGPVRPPSWNEQWYVRQWLHWTREIRSAMKKSCPELATKEKYTYVLPVKRSVSSFLTSNVDTTLHRSQAPAQRSIPSSHGKMV